MSTITAAIGRILIAVLFVFSGISKVMDPHSADQMIAGVGLPQGLGLITGICEIVGGVMLATGIMRNLAATLLGIFTVVATVLFHKNFADPTQTAMALKNLAIIGGLFLVLAQGKWVTSTVVARRPVNSDVRETRTEALAEENAAVRDRDAAVLSREAREREIAHEAERRDGQLRDPAFRPTVRDEAVSNAPADDEVARDTALREELDRREVIREETRAVPLRDDQRVSESLVRDSGSAPRRRRWSLF